MFLIHRLAYTGPSTVDLASYGSVCRISLQATGTSDLGTTSGCDAGSGADGFAWWDACIPYGAAGKGKRSQFSCLDHASAVVLFLQKSSDSERRQFMFDYLWRRGEREVGIFVSALVATGQVDLADAMRRTMNLSIRDGNHISNGRATIFRVL